MADSKIFRNVPSAVWECVKTTSFKDHGTVYAPPGALQGTAKTNTAVGEVILNYDYNETDRTITYGIVKKPFIVGAGTIWDGIQSTIDGCSKS